MSDKPAYEELERQVQDLEKKVREFKHIEKKLLDSEERFRSLLNSVGEGIFGLDTEGRHTFVNPAAAQLLGYSPQELIGQRSHALIHHTRADGGAYSEEDCPIYHAFSDGKIHHKDDEIFWRKNGSSFPVDYTSTPIWEDGELVGAVVSFLDITFRKLAEEQLRESEERYRNVYNTAPLAFVIWDCDCTITDWNIQAEKIFGWSKEEVLGRNFFQFLIPEGARPHVEDVVKPLLKGKLQSHSINENLTKTGDFILCEWNNSILYDNDGQVRGAISLALDITERKRSQEKLRKSSEKIQHFAYSVAHDLKNPTISIYGLAKRLNTNFGDSLDAKGKSYCERIQKSAEQIATLVETINAYIASKESPLCLEDVNVKEVLKILREEFSVQFNIRQITMCEPEDIPALKADKLSVLRVFRNCIDNALKYGGDALGKIEIGYEERDDYHVFSIRDDGVGLNMEESQGVFGLFKRNATSQGVEGAGLGLAIVKEIAERHQGEVWIDSGPAQGVAFYISISKYL